MAQNLNGEMNKWSAWCFFIYHKTHPIPDVPTTMEEKPAAMSVRTRHATKKEVIILQAQLQSVSRRVNDPRWHHRQSRSYAQSSEKAQEQGENIVSTGLLFLSLREWMNEHGILACL